MARASYAKLKKLRLEIHAHHLGTLALLMRKPPKTMKAIMAALPKDVAAMWDRVTAPMSMLRPVDATLPRVRVPANARTAQALPGCRPIKG